jgi:hypothetical protein
MDWTMLTEKMDIGKRIERMNNYILEQLRKRQLAYENIK